MNHHKGVAAGGVEATFERNNCSSGAIGWDELGPSFGCDDGPETVLELTVFLDAAGEACSTPGELEGS